MIKICDNTSVGMLIRNNKGNLLLIERRKQPFGFAPPAGHVDDHGSFENAAEDEVKEEVGLIPKNLKFIAEGRKNNRCRREGGDWHYWKIYEVEISGDLKPSAEETKQAEWFSVLRLQELAERTKLYLNGQIPQDKWQANPGLEPVWFEWLSELKII